MTDVATAVETLSETSSTSTVPTDAPTDSETQRTVFRAKYSYYLDPPSGTINADGQTVTVLHNRDFPLSKDWRGVAFLIAGESDVELTTCDGVTEVKSDALKRLFGEGDQWKFDATEENQESDGKFVLRAYNRSQGFPSAQAKLPADIFRAVMGIPWLETQDEIKSCASLAIVPRHLVTSIKVVHWSVRSDRRGVERNQVTCLKGQHNVELEVRLGAGWEDEKPTCYTGRTLDQGWPGIAASLNDVFKAGDDPFSTQE